MHIFEKIEEIRIYLAAQRKLGRTMGFVPTMGALHKGHVSLIVRSKAENDFTVCSIFVNPSQFNDAADLEKYPRTLEADKNMLEKAGCDLLFIPDVKEIYPVKPRNDFNIRHTDYSVVKLGDLEKVMEGARRPGHFGGVVQVVSRLFDIVEPDRAYFGQKDYQQQAVIREMCRQLNFSIQIVTCPIIREADGLAMSSRNVRLKPSERAVAGVISQTLFSVQRLADQLSVQELMLFADSEIRKVSLMELEYFRLVDGKSLMALSSLKRAESAVACIAVKLGSVRLIDNVILR